MAASRRRRCPYCDKVLVIDDSDRALTLEDDRLEQAIVRTHAVGCA